MRSRNNIWIAAGIVIFIICFAVAARPVPPETVLVSGWLSSLVSDNPAAADESEKPDFEETFPFTLGGRFGYVDINGRFPVNKIRTGELSLGETRWAEYTAAPERINIQNNLDKTELSITNPGGYPFFLDGRIFLIGIEQNALSELDTDGTVLWTYEFAAPLTCVDAAAGLVLTGSIDGAVEVLDSRGNRIFFFEPGGSRVSIVLGCAISHDGSRLGIISGIDAQRFIMLERFTNTAGEYKVSYHEFLEGGFRRPVHITFIEQDRWIVFEREGGLGLYEMGSRQGRKIAIEGEIAVIDRQGGQGLFFVIASRTPDRKALVGIRLPGRIIMEAPYKSEPVFLDRAGQRLLIGGGQTLAAFDIEQR
jgi:hypothetical protein